MGTIVRKTATLEVNQDKAYYIAEAGVERALARLQGDPNWRDVGGKELSENGYGGGAIERVYCKTAAVQKDIGKSVEITSVGSFGTQQHLAKKTLKTNVLVVSIDELTKGFSILPDESIDLVFDSNLVIDSVGNETPKLITKGSLEVAGNCIIRGDIFASGKITVSEESNLTGKKLQNYSDIPPSPNIDQDGLESKAIEQGNYLSGKPTYKFGVPDDEKEVDVDISSLNPNHVYYVDGDVEIFGTYNGGPVVIAATGNITIIDDLKKDLSGNCLIILIALDKSGIGTGGVTISVTPEEDEEVEEVEIDALIIARRNFDIKENTTLNGCVIAQYLDKPYNKINGIIRVMYNPELVLQSLPVDIFRFIPPNIKIESWDEG